MTIAMFVAAFLVGYLIGTVRRRDTAYGPASHSVCAHGLNAAGKLCEGSAMIMAWRPDGRLGLSLCAKHVSDAGYNGYIIGPMPKDGDMVLPPGVQDPEKKEVSE